MKALWVTPLLINGSPHLSFDRNPLARRVTGNVVGWGTNAEKLPSGWRSDNSYPHSWYCVSTVTDLGGWSYE